MAKISDKIEYSLELIKQSEPLAMSMQDYGFHLAFSGGKDSQVIHELAKMAGVKFKAFFNKTSVDPPEILKFIRENYPEVEWIKPKETMYQLIYRKGILPLRNVRYCCELLKENSGHNSVVITGITNQESDKRARRKELEQDYKDKTKWLLHPIKNWTVNEVFAFLKERGIKVCSLYEKQNRIGCIGCPMHPREMRKDFRERPNFKLAYTNTVRKLMVEKGKYQNFENAEEVIEWWSSGLSVKNFFAKKTQLTLELK